MHKLETYAIGSSELTYDLIEKILNDKTRLVLSDEGRERIAACREFLDTKTETDGAPIYGVTTGFGSLFWHFLGLLYFRCCAPLLLPGSLPS